MPVVDEFVARLNIQYFKSKLATETDEAKRKTLLTLLAQEEAKLATLEKQPPGDKEERG